MNKINIHSRLMFFLSIVFCSLMAFTACDDTETVDETNFAIYYTGMTDIGPSMTGIISSPSYIGGKPYDFEITGVTLDGQSYSGNSFEVNKDNGTITISQTAGIPVGHYKLSIKCFSNGKSFEFKDIIEVNMMKPVPDGITVEPDKIKADYADVIDAASEVVLPTAQVKTDGNHVSIKKYEIAKSDFSKFFAISSTGEISIVKGNADMLPGKYIISLKLTTGASGEDEGIFENAVEIDITSKPLALTYAPATGKIEEESILSGNTTYTSNAPTLKGSLDGLSYSIKSVTPATDKILIDAQTGILSVKENHGFTKGQKYMVDVNVKNIYSAEGVDFDGVFELEVVEFIEPIQNFSYANLDATQAVAFENDKSATFKGDEVRFELVDLPAALQGNISVDIDGKVSAPKGNAIPLGNYTVQVKATNPKSDPESPTIASFTLTVNANPNYFTYIHYGNNLTLTPTANYANQYRLKVGEAMPFKVEGGNKITTDATVPLTYEITALHQAGGISIDPGTGEITVTSIADKQCAIVMVTATAGKGTPEEVSVKTPVFFHKSTAVAPISNSGQSVTIEYSPFVYQVNPNSGGRSVKPVVKVNGVETTNQFTLDYRRAFNYYNFSGTHESGQPGKAGSFMNLVWKNYFDSMGSPTNNTGSRDPLSYYGNVKGSSWDKTLGYVDPATLEVIVNPNKWILNAEPANGAMVGQMTFETNGTDPQKGDDKAGAMVVFILWFDKNF